MQKARNDEIEDYTQRFLGLLIPKRAILNGSSASDKGIHTPQKVWASVRVEGTFRHFDSAGRFLALGWSTRTVDVSDAKAWDCEESSGEISEGSWPGPNPTNNNKTSGDR